MKKWLTWLGICLLLGVLMYNVWAETDRAKNKITGWVAMPEMKTHFQLVTLGSDSGKGNLVGIQPYVTPKSYSTQFNFFVTLSLYLEQLKKANLINPKTIVIFPEYIGTWLVVANEKEEVYNNNSMASAMRTMLLSNLYKFTSHYLSAPAVKRKSKHALFSMKAARMAEIYQKTFSEMASTYHVTIVAGSIILPEPRLSNGNIETGRGKLYNVSAVFDPDGKIISPLVKKIFPVNAEQEFISAGSNSELPIFKTAAGRLGVLICADSWYPDAYSPISDSVDLLAVPSLADTDSSWNARWKGYDGYKAPADVDTSDYLRISEGSAWAKYSMGTRAAHAGIHTGLNVFFTGDMWSLKPEGRVLALQQDSLSVLPPATRKGRIVNLWIQ